MKEALSDAFGKAFFLDLQTVDPLPETPIGDTFYRRQIYCDDFAGQNRNTHIIHLLSFWLKIKSPANLKKIKLTFLVRVHSFLPTD